MEPKRLTHGALEVNSGATKIQPVVLEAHPVEMKTFVVPDWYSESLALYTNYMN